MFWRAWSILSLSAVVVLGQRNTAPTPEEILLLDAPKRSDFRCAVRNFPPRLGFDLRYQVGWDAALRVSDFDPQGDRMRVVVRVTPIDPASEPLVLTDLAVLPPKDKLRGKEAVLYGGFAAGAGQYRVDWLLRDSRERACIDHWNVSVKHKDDFALDIREGQALPIGRPSRRSERRPESSGPSYKLKILANFSNTNPARSTLNRQDTAAVSAILRTIAREPRFTEFSIVAFNMQEEREFYRAEHVSRIDFRALGQGIASLRVGVIDYERLLDRASATKFVTRLLSDHLGADQQADAVLLVGPKLFHERKVPKEAIDAIAGSRPPVFYLNYVWNPGRIPWRDSLGDAVKRYGGKEFRITAPKDLGEALSVILEHLDQRRALSTRTSSELPKSDGCAQPPAAASDPYPCKPE
jgi:hypothetical protein